MRDTVNFLTSLGLVPKSAVDTSQIFRMGTIPTGYSSGLPSIQFDGESSVSSRTYPYLESYTPAAGDRVFVLLVNGGQSALIIGKIVS